MAKPNKTYLAGPYTLPTGAADAFTPILQEIFAAQVASYEVESWRDLLVGVSNNFVITFNKQVSVKYAQLINGDMVIGDVAVWRNPTPTTTFRIFNDTQRRDNHTFRIDELYVANSSGSDCTIDVEIFANNNGPFLN